MNKLSFQDAFFLRAESSTMLAHVAALMVFSAPPDAPPQYMQGLAEKIGHLNELWPAFGLKLGNPDSTRSPAWVPATDYDAANHIQHYAVPAPGGMAELLRLVEESHEQLLDRGQPLWQLHLIEGLKDRRFAVYFKVHHAVMDGVAGLQMIQRMLSTDPKGQDLQAARKSIGQSRDKESSMMRSVAESASVLLKQSSGLPEAVASIAQHGLAALAGKHDAPLPPFAAPRTILNGEIDSRRRIIVCDLPLRRLKEIGSHYGGTINDVLLAICGGALRDYLLEHGELPERSLDAGVPVSIKTQADGGGNLLSLVVCPLATEIDDPRKRLRRIIRATRKAKEEIGHMSPTATEDLATMVMLPFLLMSLTHTSRAFPPVFNTIVSNVPGPKRPLFLDGARLERLYPLSVIADGMGLNITVISYRTRLFFAMTSCPTHQPGIDSLGTRIRRAYKALLATLD